MKTVNQLEIDTIKERNETEALALELFIKDEIIKRINRTEDLEKSLNKIQVLKEEQTIEYFEKLFESYSPSGAMSNKEYYVNKVKNKN